MSSILFVAELGSGFGHARRMLPLARAATAAGYHPILVVPNPGEVVDVVGREFEVRCAPVAPMRRGPSPANGGVACGFADILGRAGFDDREFLVGAIRAWRTFLDDLRPRAAICEFSPFFCLATAGGALSVLVSGYGFVLPPPEAPRFPALLEGVPAFAEETLLDEVGAALRTSSRPPLARLPALFAGSSHAVTGLDELDCYRALRRSPAIGPPGIGVTLSENEPTEDVFAYLLGDAPGTDRMLEVIAVSGVRGRVFVRRGTAAQRAAVAESKVAWLERPEAIGPMLARARLVVHHGSMLTSEEALVTGRPQLVVPIYLEHLLTARELIGLGTTRVLTAATPAGEMRAALEAALADEPRAAAARGFARRHLTARAPDIEPAASRLLRRIL